MKQSEAWLRQARSDYDAAQRVIVKQNSTTYCHAVAKYQQCVEKSIKAMVAAVNELGVEFFTITASHAPDKEIRMLQNLKRAIDNTSVNQIARVFSEKRLLLIDEISRLAPRYPRVGEVFTRNTEYPYTLPSGEWMAPAAPNAFTEEEVNRYQSLAREIYQNVSRFVGAVKLGRTA